MDRKELYAAVTAQVVAQVEAGAGEWHMPWHAIANAGEPVNASTGNAYRGGNHLVFGMVAVANDWSGNWATYKQWKDDLGAQVRRGERATRGVKWSPVEDRVTGERRLIPFCFSVFNAAQVDGWEAPDPIERDTPERIAAAETFFSALGADVRHGGNRAAYSPIGDYIVLPELSQFGEASDYYATSAHEHSHWTGHTSRLARDLSGRFGSDSCTRLKNSSPNYPRRSRALDLAFRRSRGRIMRPTCRRGCASCEPTAAHYFTRQPKDKPRATISPNVPRSSKPSNRRGVMRRPDGEPIARLESLLATASRARIQQSNVSRLVLA